MNKKEVVGFIPKILYKIFLYLKERFDPKIPITDEEKIILEICDKLIGDGTSKLTLAPISGKRFIKNKEKNLFIVLEKNVINISNNIYTHSLFISDYELYHNLISKFDKSLDNERMRLEIEMQDNLKNSLRRILDNINEI